MPERPTFSPMWHRVRAMTPRLRPHAQITRQHYRGRRWHVVHDPASNQFYRLSPIAHQFVGLLDGRRTVEQAWQIVLAEHGDGAPTQQEVVELVSQMYNANLLAADASPEVEQLLRRGRERLRKRIKQQAIGIMYFRMRLFNPDGIVSWVEPLLRPLIGRWGMLAWTALMVVALVRLIPHAEELAGGFEDAIAPANWPWLIVVFLVAKALHELGHGVICKRFGGQVPEFGVMLLVLFPAPYVDASACWAFPSKWQRIAVGAGGMLFELALAAGASFVWVATLDRPGTLVHQLAYNAMFTASISTVLFNANPLMRFDGYYILADLLEVPNLMQRSMNMLKYLAQRYLLRAREARSPTSSPAEATILLTYGVAASIYRVFLFIGITLYVMGKLFAIGLVLAIWTAVMWFLLPLGTLVHWLATSPRLAEGRARAILTTIAITLLGAAAIGVVRVPDRRYAWGVVESPVRAGIFFRTDGFVVQSHKRIGDHVRAGEAIVVCENPDLDSALASATAELAELVSLERRYNGTGEVAAAQVARRRIEVQRERIAWLGEQIDGLTVRAPFDGRIVRSPDGLDPATIVGARAQRGAQLCEVIDDRETEVAATVNSVIAGPLRELGRRSPGLVRVELRRLADVDRVYDVREIEPPEAARERLPSAALGAMGGGQIATQPHDPTGLLARSPQFTVRLRDIGGESGAAWSGVPGERVRVRFTLDDKPLLSQWLDRLRRVIQERINL